MKKTYTKPTTVARTIKPTVILAGSPTGDGTKSINMNSSGAASSTPGTTLSKSIGTFSFED